MIVVTGCTDLILEQMAVKVTHRTLVQRLRLHSLDLSRKGHYSRFSVSLPASVACFLVNLIMSTVEVSNE
jgi:hypothetical protein